MNHLEQQKTRKSFLERVFGKFQKFEKVPIKTLLFLSIFQFISCNPEKELSILEEPNEGKILHLQDKKMELRKIFNNSEIIEFSSANEYLEKAKFCIENIEILIKEIES